MQLRSLVAGRRGALAALAIASVLAGFTESGVLAILAQSATALVNGVSRVHLHFGPVHLDETLGLLLIVGLVLAFSRLGLQVVISAVPAQMVAETQARLRTEVFAAFTRASWSEQSRDREGHLQELVTNQVAQAIQSVVQAATLIDLGTGVRGTRRNRGHTECSRGSAGARGCHCAVRAPAATH